jgi:putative oxidoreductase
MANPRAVFTGRYTRLAPLFIRLPVGWHLIYGTQDNLLSWERMIEFRDFLAQHNFPIPLVCAIVSVVAQFAAGCCYVLGFQTRLAAGLMVFNFLVAVFGVHIAQGHGYGPTFPALMMLCASIYLLLAGPGAWSIDERSRAQGGRSSS